MITAKTKSKAAGIPPLPPSTKASISVHKMQQLRDEEEKRNDGEEEEKKIEEEISVDLNETDSELYQFPISGGVPLKLNYESRRPFTPPFAQMVQFQQQQLQKEQAKEGVEGNILLMKQGEEANDVLRDSLEMSIRVIEQKQRQYVFDEKLGVYFDPETNEYFKLKGK